MDKEDLKGLIFIIIVLITTFNVVFNFKVIWLINFILCGICIILDIKGD
jgi:hypothetical protein